MPGKGHGGAALLRPSGSAGLSGGFLLVVDDAIFQQQVLHGLIQQAGGRDAAFDGKLAEFLPDVWVDCRGDLFPVAMHWTHSHPLLSLRPGPGARGCLSLPILYYIF